MKISHFKKDLAKIGVPYKLVRERFDQRYNGYSSLRELILNRNSSFSVISSLCRWRDTPEGFDYWATTANLLDRLNNRV
jgi:hypothetical protein